MAGIAALIAVLVLIVGYYAMTSSDETICDIAIIILLLPTVVICEHLGLGHFSFLGPSTIPDWAFITVGIFWVYVLSLIAVIASRLLWRCVCGVGLLVGRNRNDQAPTEIKPLTGGENLGAGNRCTPKASKDSARGGGFA